MAGQSLFIYTGPAPLSNDQKQDANHGQYAVTPGGRDTYHYHAIPTGVKGVKPYLALSSIPIITAAHLPPQANNQFHHPSPIDTTKARSGPGSTLPSSASPDEAEAPHSSTVSASVEQPRPRRKVPWPEFKEDRIPPGKAEDIIAWTDDDVDATDYKNMPGYDPNQEESEYDSTPPPEAEIVASQTLFDSAADAFLVRRYVRIYNSAPTSSVEEVSGYVLEPSSSTDNDAPAQYLIVQELSEMERRAGRNVGVNWERKRKEAKHWWRKEERGARGVKVGFFKLADAEQMQKY